MSDKKFHALAKKGDGALVRSGSVWTYPGAEMDRSGTNLRLPVEYVTDAEVQEALGAGHLTASVHGLDGQVAAVRVAKDGEGPTAIPMTMVGTSEAGTELPPNSRPTHDAAKATPAEIEGDKLGPPPPPPEAKATPTTGGRK
jgi:hypothetical protein